MVVIEIVHYLKSKTRGKSCDVALKLDISKAYRITMIGIIFEVLC
jgi:hypothetical protein